jgi:hypothetical protein
LTPAHPLRDYPIQRGSESAEPATLGAGKDDSLATPLGMARAATARS